MNQKSTKDLRHCQMKINWTEDEELIIKANARMAGVAPSVYVRMLALHSLTLITKPSPVSTPNPLLAQD